MKEESSPRIKETISESGNETVPKYKSASRRDSESFEVGTLTIVLRLFKDQVMLAQ